VTALYFIKSGTVGITRDAAVSLPERAGDKGFLCRGRHWFTLSPRRQSNCHVRHRKRDRGMLRTHKARFHEVRQLSPEFDRACRELAAQRLEQLEKYQVHGAEAAQNWVLQAERSLRVSPDFPSELQLKSESEKHSGAPLAIGSEYCSTESLKAW